MFYFTIPPPNHLKNLVRFFWVLESGKLSSPYIHRSMADSCTEILFHYKGVSSEIFDSGKREVSFLAGIHSQSHKVRRFIVDESFGIFGAYLYPYAAKQLLALSPSELTNQLPDLQSAIGKEGRDLEEQIMQAPDNKTRTEILSRFLTRRLFQARDDEHPVRAAVQHVIHSKKYQRVGELARQFNLSERQFERKFREYSGFSPKLCMRIVRFEQACSRYGHTEQKPLTEIAHECGYYDQSHFIHDFKEFSGFEPGHFFSGNAEGTEWRENQH